LGLSQFPRYAQLFEKRPKYFVRPGKFCLGHSAIVTALPAVSQIGILLGMDIELFQDSTLRAVIIELLPRLLPMGQLVAVVDANVYWVEASRLLPPTIQHVDLMHWPNAMMHDKKSGWLYAIDVATLRGQLSTTRCSTLSTLINPSVPLVIVNAFSRRSEFNLEEYRPWFTSAWFADDPGHILHFGGAIDWHEGARGCQQPTLRVTSSRLAERGGHPHVQVPFGASAEIAFDVQI
jgi:hypothetical protein